MGCPKTLLEFFYNILWKSPHILFGQPSILLWKPAHSRGSNWIADFTLKAPASRIAIPAPVRLTVNYLHGSGTRLACSHILHFSQLCPIPLLLLDLVRCLYTDEVREDSTHAAIFSSSPPIVKHHESIRAFSFPTKPRFGSRVLPTKVLR